MKISDNNEIKEILERLKEGMMDFIEPGETAYSKSDVDNCLVILSNYLQGIENAETKENAMDLVKKTVLELNGLNENCDFELIETDQREDIAEIIILAGSIKGFNSKDEDITEEWREW